MTEAALSWQQAYLPRFSAPDADGLVCHSGVGELSQSECQGTELLSLGLPQSGEQ